MSNFHRSFNQDICLTVQEAMDEIASIGERIKNTFNWTVPFMSIFAVVILSVVATLLYFVPCRIIILLWGCNKVGASLVFGKIVSA